MKKVILVGGGGHALSLIECIENLAEIAGYSDVAPCTQIPIPYLGTDDDVLAHFSPKEYQIHHTLVYTTEVNLRLRTNLIQKYMAYEGHTFTAPTSIITHNCKIGEGCAIMHRAVVNHATMGRHCIVNTGAVIEHGVTLGNNVFIGPSAVICGDVTIGDNVLIGAGSIIRDGIKICAGATIGMGAVVTQDIDHSGVYMGIPAKMKKK